MHWIKMLTIVEMINKQVRRNDVDDRAELAGLER